MLNQQFNFSESMNEIDQINDWFQHDDLDLEEALIKLKRGKELIKLCKVRLDNIENEFKELKSDFENNDFNSSEEVGVLDERIKLEDEDLADDIPF